MYDSITLPGGLRVVSEPMRDRRSAAVGVWVGAGSRCERAGEAGSAHFIEHMLFKGSARRSAAALAADMDAIGGQCNAFTTRENTCFYIRCLDSHLDAACEMLAEMFFESRFDAADVENERGVILEEIDMCRDTPEDLVLEQLLGKCFPGALGREVLGRPAALAKMTGESLRAFMEREYCPERVVLALTGSFTDAQLRHLTELFAPLAPRRAPKSAACRYAPAVVLRRKSTEQNHFCLGWEGLPIGHDDRFALDILSTILGDGLSSRLFQTVREKNGLCYSISSLTASFRETGLFGVCTAVGRETERRALALVAQELQKLREDGVTAAELDRAKELIKANMLMSAESTSSRMTRLGNAVLTLGRCPEPEESLARYAAVTRQDVLALSQRLLTPETLSFSAVGHPDAAPEYLALFRD